MAIDHVLHPPLELSSNEIFDVNLVELLGVDLIFVGHLNLRVSYLDQIPFNWQRLSIFAQILLFVKDWVHGNELGPILQLHEFVLNYFQFFL